MRNADLSLGDEAAAGAGGDDSDDEMVGAPVHVDAAGPADGPTRLISFVFRSVSSAEVAEPEGGAVEQA